MINGGPAQYKALASASLTVNASGNVGDADAEGTVGYTVGPCSDATCTLTIHHFILDSTAPFPVGGRTVTSATIENFDLVEGTLNTSTHQFSIPAGSFAGQANVDISGLGHASQVLVNQQAVTGTIVDGQFALDGTLSNGGNSVGFDLSGPTTGNTPPVAGLSPSNPTVECSGPSGASQVMSSTTQDPEGDTIYLFWSQDGAQLPLSAAQVTLNLSKGDHTIRLLAKDNKGAIGYASASVTVADRTPPVFTQVPTDRTVGTCRPVLGPAAASDLCDGPTTPSNNAPPVLPLGTSSIVWSASDQSGNTRNHTQIVTVVGPPVFTSTPSDVAVGSCTETPDLGVATAVDICGNPATVTNDAPSSYPLGTTLVTWTARDAQGSTASYVQRVVVGGPPRFTTKPGSVDVTFCDGQPSIGIARAVDVCGGDASVTNDAPTTFPVGTTVVTWRATDRVGNTSTHLQRITISAAIDMGAEHASTSVANNACLQVSKYPRSWNPYMHTVIIQLQSGGTGWPVSFGYANCSRVGSGNLGQPWQQAVLQPVSASCPTLVKLKGNGSANVSLTWWGNG